MTYEYGVNGVRFQRNSGPLKASRYATREYNAGVY
jgi:hypothetical protein